MSRERFQRQSLGSTFARIKESRVLMVGAGGIGCELLKNLVLSGFGEVHIVDLDTIDLSNLNRQFLFRHEHIKKSKALVAKEAASKFNPNIKLEAHHANIKDPQFNIDFFKSFDIVFNALDNLEARRHVNKMCLAADVPLIESGTTGFKGQVTVIKRSRSECYDCITKETPKTFPVCTIRSTPSQPIHCIVWAKSYLFAEIFGTSEDDSPDLDTTQDSDNAKEMEELRHEAQALKRVRAAMGSVDFPRKVFDKVFTEDVNRLRSMEDMWRTRKKPEPLDFDALSQAARDVSTDIATQDQKAWTAPENFAVFVSSLQRLSERLDSARATAEAGNAAPIISFDKDDKDTLDFVAASANLRSIIFSISTRSEFDIKKMAGNIIPAIATTNAITAGLCVLQAFKVLRNEYDKARTVFLTNAIDAALAAEPLQPPRPDCPVCGVSQARISVDMSRATLDDLVHGLLQGQLGYTAELSVSSDAGILYDPELEDNLPRKLSDLGVAHDSFLTIVDEEDEDARVNVLLAVSVEALPPGAAVVLKGKFEIARKAKAVTAAAAQDEAPHARPTNGHARAATADGAAGKRKRERDENGDMDIVAKRGKVLEDGAGLSGVEVLVVADDDSGAIVLDDD